MVDEKVAHSLEQEAIALVNLSNPKQFALSQQKAALEVSDKGIKEEDAQEDDASMELLDGSISMKSLLVTLKKRKLQHQVKEETTESETGSETASVDDMDSAKLPSFRAVFQPRQEQDEKESVTDNISTEFVAPELKCKYRTGKCHNARALKSCGDYHNLCNYHRLRANANQRKLDRKKKEQRLQQQQLTADALACVSSPATSNQPILASSHAAAAALASLVAAQPQHHFDVLQEQQRPNFVSDGTEQAAEGTDRNRGTSATSCVRPKLEDACSY